MVILTGGAGFIGSCFLWKLNNEGVEDILVVDNLNSSDKWRNLEGKRFKDYLQKDIFLDLVRKNKFSQIDYVIHMGACTSTILNDADYFIKNNYEYSKILAHWVLNNNIPFMYASSGATYGNGEYGFNDDNETTYKLKPLNIYGFSKHLFDLWVLNNGFEDRVTGFKFFNVFGPNEYHKGEMRSVICKKFEEVEQGYIKLFRSYRDEYEDGEQKRDFVYIKDVVEIIFYFFIHPEKTGIFNVGSGKAHTWKELAQAMFKALGKKTDIKYIDMPENLKGKYQYFTQANIDKLIEAGCKITFLSLEESVRDYIVYLKENKRI